MKEREAFRVREKGVWSRGAGSPRAGIVLPLSWAARQQRWAQVQSGWGIWGWEWDGCPMKSDESDSGGRSEERVGTYS